MDFLGRQHELHLGGTMRASPQAASPQGGVFYVSSSVIPLRLVSKVCGVYSYRVLPSRPGRQPRAMEVAYTVWGISHAKHRGFVG